MHPRDLSIQFSLITLNLKKPCLSHHAPFIEDCTLFLCFLVLIVPTHLDYFHLSPPSVFSLCVSLPLCQFVFVPPCQTFQHYFKQYSCLLSPTTPLPSPCRIVCLISN
ncbi:unnamed protein product [Lota lota]